MSEQPFPADPAPAARAGFAPRLGAALIDGVIIVVAYFVVYLVSEGLALLVAIVGGLAYTVYFEGSERGQTPGKMALGIRVVDAQAGGPIGYSRAFVRWLGKIVSGLPCYLGYLWMLWDADKQTWHDKIASTYVVRAEGG